MDLASDFFHYLWLVFFHWQAYVTGGGITALLLVYERLSKQISKRAFIWLVFGGFLVGASFTSWRDAYSSMKGREIDMHNLEIRLLAATKEHGYPVTPLSVTVQPAAVIIKPDPVQRGLTNEEKVRFQSAISAIDPGHIEELFYLSGDMDSKTVKEDTYKILIQHQWKIPEVSSGGLGEDFYGIRMYLNYADVIPSYYGGLRRAFETVWPVEAHEYKHPEYRSGDAHLQIDIGHRSP